MAWKIFRHKVNPKIRYWVETAVPIGSSEELIKLRQDEDGEPLVRIKSVRNVRFDKYDFPPHQALEAGLWPFEAFKSLYEPDPNDPVYSPDTVISA